MKRPRTRVPGDGAREDEKGSPDLRPSAVAPTTGSLRRSPKYIHTQCTRGDGGCRAAAAALDPAIPLTHHTSLSSLSPVAEKQVSISYQVSGSL